MVVEGVGDFRRTRARRLIRTGLQAYNFVQCGSWLEPCGNSYGGALRGPGGGMLHKVCTCREVA